MYIRDIYLGDFGIFSREKITDLDPGLVVIGGGNRAGKTTFMQALRHLGYGFPRDGSLPSPADEYEVAVSIVRGEGERELELKLTGYGRPHLAAAGAGTGAADSGGAGKPAGGEAGAASGGGGPGSAAGGGKGAQAGSAEGAAPEAGAQPTAGEQPEKGIIPDTARELYGGLDRFTYRQLFTISLEELRKEPEGVSGQEERQRLQAVLLGAGLSRMVELPRLARRYERRARDIAGKYGRPDVGQLKPYHQQIREAEEERQEALEQVEKYRQVEEEIEDLEQKREETEEEIAELQRDQLRLDVLENNFDALEESRELAVRLERHPGRSHAGSEVEYSAPRRRKAESLLENWRELREDFREKRQKFSTALPSDTAAHKASASPEYPAGSETPAGTDDPAESSNNLERVRSLLMERSGEIEDFHARLSGLKERVNSLRERRRQLRQRRLSFREEAASISPELADAPGKLEDIPADMIEREKLARAGEVRSRCRDELARLEQEESEIEQELNSLLASRNELKSQAAAAGRARRYTAAGLAGSVLLAAIALLVEPAAAALRFGGLAAAALVLAVSISFQLGRRRRSRQAEERLQELKSRREDLDDRLEDIRAEMRSLRSELVPAENYLEKCRRQLGLEEEKEDDISPSLLLNYYSSVAQLKGDYRRLEQEEDELASAEEKLTSELQELAGILGNLEKSMKGSFFSPPGSENLLEQSGRIFSALESAAELLEKARDLTASRSRLDELEARIRKNFADAGGIAEAADAGGVTDAADAADSILTTYIERAEKALDFRELKERQKNLEKQLQDTLKSSQRLSSAFPRGLTDLRELFAEYSSAAGAAAQREELAAELEELRSELAEITDRLSSLRHRRQELASPESLHSAQARLDRARSEMRGLAEEFARNQTISFLLRRVRERALDRAEEELLNPAADLLKEMTGGEYSDIEPDQEEGDFRAVTSQSGSPLPPDLLSRATREQLYLAVRFSRIREIEPPLPVILDDTLVNFDREHLSQAAAIITRLARRNQVFVLTCHPELIRMLEGGQHWLLERGEFARMSQGELEERLSE